MSKSVGGVGDDEEKPVQGDSRGERITRMIVYFVGIGIFVDLGVFFARFNRHNSSHDEFHAVFMFLGLIAAFAMDIWFVVREWNRFFKDNLTFDIYFGLIVGANLLAIPQMIVGNVVRFKMRAVKGPNNYLTIRFLHKLSGLLIYTLCKAKLFFLARVEDNDQIVSAGSTYKFQIIVAAYCSVVIFAWLIASILVFGMSHKFRNKVIQDNTGIFNAAEREAHKRILDMKSDPMVEHNLKSLFKGVNWVVYEDRIFDITDLDHPGGRYLTATLCGKEISRFMFGQNEYIGPKSKKAVTYRHSPFAMNMLEHRFIGFAKIPKVIDRYEIVSDIDESVLSLNKLVQLKEDRKYKMKNENYFFDFAIVNVDQLTPDFSCATFHSEHVKFNLTENPFTLFGMYFNLRHTSLHEPHPFDVVLSRSPNFKMIKHNLLANFFAKFSAFKNDLFVDVTAAKDMHNIIDELPKSTRKMSKDEAPEPLVIQKSASTITPLEDIMDNRLNIIFKVNSTPMARKFLSVPAKSAGFEIRGPFGSGFGLTRHSYGNILMIGQGTGTFPFIDLVDYLARYYLYQYASQKLTAAGDKQSLSQLDPLKDDFDLTFHNNPKFSFYLTFKNKHDFEALFLRDFHLITQIENELKLGLVGKIVVRLEKSDSTYGERFPFMYFTNAKVSKQNFMEFLGALDLAEERVQQNLEHVYAAGRTDFVNEIKTGFESIGLPSRKFKSF